MEDYYLPQKHLAEKLSRLDQMVANPKKYKDGGNGGENPMGIDLTIAKLITSVSTRFMNISSKEIDKEIENSLRLIVEFIGGDQGYLFLLQKEGEGFKSLYYWGSESVSLKYGNHPALIFSAFKRALKNFKQFQDIWIQNLKDLPAEAISEKKIFQSLGIQSILAIPLSRDQEKIGLIGLNSVDREKIWNKKDIKLLKLIGEIFINVLERKREDLDGLEREKPYRTVYDMPKVGASCMRLEKDGRFVREWVTESLSQIFGVDLAELNSIDSYVSLIHPDDLPIFYGLLLTLAKKCEPTSVELRALAKNGEVRWIQDTIYPIWDEQEQRIVRLIHAVQDITERKKTLE